MSRRFCRCDQPVLQADADGVTYCDRCGELLPAPMELVAPQLLRIVSQMKRQIDVLSARLPETSPSPDGHRKLVDARVIAAEFGLSRDYIYDHSERLGAVRLGNGPKARLRFNPDSVARALTAAPPASSNGPVCRTHRKTSTKTHD